MTDKEPAAESGRQPEREVRTFPFEIEEVRDAESGRSKDFTIKGHAAVFNTWTDLGFMRERIAKTAFDEVLSRDPHVVHTIDHDTKWTLSSTRSKTLELRVDPKGLHMWSKVAPTSYAADLRISMERGDIDQSSFAFTVAEDTWKDDTEDGKPERTITRIGELYDVTTTAMGAYPTTDSQVAMRTREKALRIAREGLSDSTPAEDEDAAPEGEAVETKAPLEDEAADEASAAAQDNPAARARAELELLKKSARERKEHFREAQWSVLKEK